MKILKSCVEVIFTRQNALFDKLRLLGLSKYLVDPLAML